MISIITCTNRPQFKEHIFLNYERQKCNQSEFIIILNGSHMRLDEWEKKAKEYPNIRIYQLPPALTLGECLNFGIEKARFDIIAKFDDDDYYGPRYLDRSVKYLIKEKADIVGKTTAFIYFQKEQKLGVFNPFFENKFINNENKIQHRVVFGGTIVFKKDVWKEVQFKSVKAGTDAYFCIECLEKNYKIYSCDRFDYAYIRYDDRTHHTGYNKNNRILKDSVIVAETADYQSYVNYY